MTLWLTAGQCQSRCSDSEAEPPSQAASLRQPESGPETRAARRRGRGGAAAWHRDVPDIALPVTVPAGPLPVAGELGLWGDCAALRHFSALCSLIDSEPANLKAWRLTPITPTGHARRRLAKPLLETNQGLKYPKE